MDPNLFRYPFTGGCSPFIFIFPLFRRFVGKHPVCGVSAGRTDDLYSRRSCPPFMAAGPVRACLDGFRRDVLILSVFFIRMGGAKPVWNTVRARDRRVFLRAADGSDQDVHAFYISEELHRRISKRLGVSLRCFSSLGCAAGRVAEVFGLDATSLFDTRARSNLFGTGFFLARLENSNCLDRESVARSSVIQ